MHTRGCISPLCTLREQRTHAELHSAEVKRAGATLSSIVTRHSGGPPSYLGCRGATEYVHATICAPTLPPASECPHFSAIISGKRLRTVCCLSLEALQLDSVPNWTVWGKQMICDVCKPKRQHQSRISGVQLVAATKSVKPHQSVRRLKSW